jgi:hypothetical protein
MFMDDKILSKIIFNENFHDQTFGDDSGEWPVPEIWEIAKQTKPLKIPLEKLDHLLTDPDTSADEPIGSPEFVERSMKADLSYPILVISYPDNNLFIADGLHRLWKAKQLGLKTIEGYIIPREKLS